MAKYRDFDAFRAEAEQEGPTFTLYGKEHRLPPSLPLALMVKAARLQAQNDDPDAVIEPEVLIELAEGVFGKENVDEWSSRGMDVDLLAELISWLPDAYEAEDEDDEDGESDSGN